MSTRAIFQSFLVVAGFAPCALAGDSALIAGQQYVGEFPYCVSYQAAKSLKDFDLKAIAAGTYSIKISSTIDCYQARVTFEPIALDLSLQSQGAVDIKDPNGTFLCAANNNERCRVKIFPKNFVRATFIKADGDRVEAYLLSSVRTKVIDAQGNSIVEYGNDARR